MSVITFAHRGAGSTRRRTQSRRFAAPWRPARRGIETDVWLSGDGEVVCAHDPVVARGLRRRKIASTSAADLAEYGIPRLADVYRELGTDFECSVDVKSPDAATGLVEVAAVVRRLGAALGVLARRRAARARCARASEAR